MNDEMIKIIPVAAITISFVFGVVLSAIATSRYYRKQRERNKKQMLELFHKGMSHLRKNDISLKELQTSIKGIDHEQVV